ncbi:hypothetical protein FQN49_000991 [Arthroderma sp. PD_2]|nr:hypothetical protein FQN49_000991 [Arthroderma sp. PD_2]
MNGSNDSSVAGTGADDESVFYRKLIRLIQCSCCNLPLKAPVELPCGNTICRSCIPETHHRNNTTYPGTEGRSLGFYCPSLCSQNQAQDPAKSVPAHCLADCSLDITLGNVVDIFDKCVKVHSPDRPLGRDIPIGLHISTPRTNPVEPEPEFQIQGGRLIGTYSLTTKGHIPATSNTRYIFAERDRESLDNLDEEVLEAIKADVLKELDCQICYSLMVDPYTTVCGHTFCRLCVTRMLDNSSLCPVCRRKLPMILPTDPGNKVLDAISSMLFPSRVTTRLEGLQSEKPESSSLDELPLFVCTVSFPSMPTYLHVFEPRYRRMILRVVENGSRRFGSVMFNRNGELGGQLENCVFAQYGTLLEIDRLESLPGGRTLIRATGRYRFRVITGSEYDDCKVGRVERLDDIRIPDEEMLEAEETSRYRRDGEANHLNALSTQNLFQIGIKFVTKCRANNASWLNDRMISAYGEPPTDPATFPYWFASVLPIPSEEKYKLLSVTTVRGRLKICAKWVEQIEKDKQLLRKGTRSTFHHSAFLPFLFMFCIWFLPTLISAILNFANISTPITSTATSSPFSVSFSVFPLGFSFSYSPGSTSPPPGADQNFGPNGFIYPSFNISQYFSKNLLLGGILVVCVARVLRRFLEVIYQHQRTATHVHDSTARSSTTPPSPREDSGNANLGTEQSYTGAEAGDNNSTISVHDTISVEIDE